MSKSMLLAVLFVLSVALPVVNAYTPPGFQTGSTGSIFSITPYSSAIYAFIFGATIFVIAFQALQRTTMGGGAAAISLALGAITFVLLYTTPQLLQLFLNITVVVITFVVLLAVVMLPSRYLRGKTATKLLGILLLLVMMYLIFANPEYSSFTSSVSRMVGFNVSGIISITIVIVVLALLVLMFVRLFRRSRAPFVRVVIPLIIVFLLMIFLVPGFGAFFLSVPGIASVILAAAGIIYLLHRAGREPKGVTQGEEQSKPTRAEKKRLKFEQGQEIKKKTAFEEYAGQVRGELSEDDRLAQAQLKQATAKKGFFERRRAEKKQLKLKRNQEAKTQGALEEYAKQVRGELGEEERLSQAQLNQIPKKKGFFGRRREKVKRYNESIGNMKYNYSKYYSCPVCGRAAPSKTALQTHIVNKHPSYYKRHKSRYEGFWTTRRDRRLQKDMGKYEEDIKKYQ